MPRSWIFLTCASLLGTTTLLVISLLDLGYLSLWANPCIAIYTYVYHAGVIFIAFRKRHATTPSYFSTVIICGYILALLWLGALVATIVVLATADNAGAIASLRAHGLPVNVNTQRVQVFLTLYEIVVVGGMAAKGHAIVRIYGPDPPDWRYAIDESKGYWDALRFSMV